MMGPAVGSQDRLFYAFNLEDVVPANHLLRIHFGSKAKKACLEAVREYCLTAGDEDGAAEELEENDESRAGGDLRGFEDVLGGDYRLDMVNQTCLIGGTWRDWTYNL